VSPRRLAGLLRALWNWRRKESDLEDEIAFHLSEEADDRRAGGLSAEQARAAAMRDFGNVLRVREATRDTWGWASAERLHQDVRSAVRTIRRDAGFAAVAVLTLALGIGATTAVMNVVHALLIRSLPLPDADRLVVLYATTPARDIFRDTTSFHDFSAWKSQSHAFTDAAAYRRDAINITGNPFPEPLHGLRGTEALLNVLGVRPQIGRTFDQAEQRANAPVALISDDVWTRRYGRHPDVLSRTIVLNDMAYAVIGVLPPGFQFPPFQETDVLVPIPERPCRSCGYLRGIARLKPDVPLSTAQRELDAIAAGREKAFPDSNSGRGVNVVPLQEVTVGAVRTPLLVLLGAGAFVLLIGCGNVGNLVLARSLGRRREFAIRSALGAGTTRLIRQLLTESITLALVAALLGTVLAFPASRLLSASLTERFRLPEVAFNWSFLGFAVVLAAASGLLSALPPVLMVWKSNPGRFLQQDGRGGTDPSHRRLREVLMTSQTALTVVLLIGAGLLLKSFVALRQIELGLDPRQVLTADLLLSKRNADPARRDQFLREVLDVVRRLPDVQFAGLQTDSAVQGGGSRETFTIDGRPDPAPDRGHAAAANLIGGDLLEALGVTLVRGRRFDAGDTPQGLPVAIVNETMARQFWPDDDPIGKRLRLYYDKDSRRWITIVGVVRDARLRYEPPAPQIFLPDLQRPYESLPYANPPYVSLVVRLSGDPAAFAGALQAGIWTIDRDQPIMHVQPLEQILWQSVAEPRVYALLVGIFAAVALLISTAGIYALFAFVVVRRTREIGIRLAIGATSRQILALVLRGGMRLTLVGAAIGIAAALALSRVMSGFLHGITPTDPETFAVVPALVGAAAAVATYIPARRAATIDPVVAVRGD
jgi:putative ABC transport system permease protein